jgi:hypothetical protein
LTGAAGYYLAAELSRRGWLATVTIKNAPGTDVLAQDAETGRVIALQTKTASPGSGFRLTMKDEATTENENEWYALVGLGGLDARPDFFLVPRNVIATIVYVSHRDWLLRTSKSGQPHKDSPLRGCTPVMVALYRERWDWLLKPTHEVPFEVPDAIRTAVVTVGLQEGHPEPSRVTDHA